MEKDVTIHVVNGSSLGGGEMDSIIRASLSGGLLLALQPPVEVFRALATVFGVEIIDRKAFVGKTRSRNVTLTLNGFLRDLTLIPTIVLMKLQNKGALSIVLAVHSDPLSGLKRPRAIVRLALLIYQVFGYFFARRIRFVSERQLESFPLLARRRPFYIDAPTSIPTRALSPAPTAKASGNRPVEFLFIGRLSSSRLLGDAKNSDFVGAFSDYLETQPHDLSFAVVSAGNRKDVLERLSKNTRTKLIGPTNEVGELLSQARIVIVPSLHEGYCLLVREAVLSGCHVLATRAIAPELQSLDGVTIMEGFDPSEWLAAGLAVTI